jgi:N-glycosylase/DNA lyase
MGFRAKYVFDAARRITTGEMSLDDVQHAVEAGGDAASLLFKIKGVGPKVAACALLYGFGDLSQFPSDVWIKRTAGKYFDDPKKLGKLSPYAGVLQQYIYHFERNIASDGNIKS